jgi:C-terminal processing protease CtpA/Prc
MKKQLPQKCTASLEDFMNKKVHKVLKAVGILLILALILASALYTQLWNAPVQACVQKDSTLPMTPEQRVEDFNYLYDILKECFPYFQVKERQYGIDWLSRKDEFVERIRGAQSDEEFYVILEEILTLLQNGHTNIIAPGSEYTELSQLYRGPIPWSQVYNHDQVKQRYAYWESIIPENKTWVLPVSFRYIEGKYYAYRNLINPERTPDEFGVPLGTQLLKVDGVDVEQYISSLVTQRRLVYDTIRQKYKISHFAIRTRKDTTLTLRLPTGEEKTKVLKAYSYDPLGQSEYSLPEHLYSTEILEEGRIAYLKIPSLSSSYVEKDREGLRAFFNEIKDYTTLIIDIRGNGGGSTNYWMQNILPPLTQVPLSTKNYLLFRDADYLKPFIKHKTFLSYFGLKPLSQLSVAKDKSGYYFKDDQGIYLDIEYRISPQKPVGFKGRILLLVDDYVYSSAEAFAVFAKATGWATLIGTRTGGDGIGFDPVPVALPNSGLIVRFPADMGLNPDGSVNEEVATQPDIYVEPSYADYMKRIGDGKLYTELSVRESLPYDTILRRAMEEAQSSN